MTTRDMTTNCSDGRATGRPPKEPATTTATMVTTVRPTRTSRWRAGAAPSRRSTGSRSPRETRSRSCATATRSSRPCSTDRRRRALDRPADLRVLDGRDRAEFADASRTAHARCPCARPARRRRRQADRPGLGHMMEHEAPTCGSSGRPIPATPAADHRTHRKVMVCDELVGFTGGVGIADEWIGDGRSRGRLARHPRPARRVRPSPACGARSSTTGSRPSPSLFDPAFDEFPEHASRVTRMSR